MNQPTRVAGCFRATDRHQFIVRYPLGMETGAVDAIGASAKDRRSLMDWDVATVLSYLIGLTVAEDARAAARKMVDEELGD